MDDFELELKQGFLEEAEQLLVEAEQCFLSLEESPSDISLIDQLFRLAHNLKGSSRAVGFEEMGHFTHQLESLLLKIKNQEILTTNALVDLLLRTNDHLNHMVNELKSDLDAKVDSSDLLVEIEIFSNGAESSPPPIPSSDEEVYEIPSASDPSWGEPLEEAVQVQESSKEVPEAQPKSLVEAEEIPLALSESKTKAETEKKAVKQSVKSEESIRVNLQRLDLLINYVGELVILETVLQEQAHQSGSLFMRKIMGQLGKVTREVQDISMGLRMIPIKQTFQKMQRIVRDSARDLEKNVKLHIEGEETEVDKTVLEELNDPLVHIIRNAVDHGVEGPAGRIEKDKPEQANIYLSASHKSGRMVIEIRDDGKGIDPDIIFKKAIEKGVVSEDKNLSREEKLQLIFAPGFSTKSQVTDLSGRGVGMDVVKTNIKKLQGEVELDSEVGKGSSFRLILPLTLSIIDGMIILANGQRFVVPLGHVHESLQASNGDFHYLTGVGRVLHLRGENLPLVDLGGLLGKREESEISEESSVIVVRISGSPFAVLVDEILGRHQVVIKQLGKELSNIKGFSGSSILGDGRPALILELPELMKSYHKISTGGVRASL